MSEILKCNRCGAPMPPDSPEGLCPRCLVALNLATQTEIAGETGPHGTQVNKPPPAPLLPVEEVAKLFPQLEILECLGRGGMGAVYKARQPTLDRFVALKILAPKSSGDLDFAGRFTREARALARLSHPNIVGVYDFGQINGLSYFIMEFVDGLNLRQLEQAGKLSPRETLQIIPQICEALQFAHDEGIVHRDIKPENILLDKKGRVKIADFGLAKILGQEPKDFRLTGVRDVVGTPHYMAPEQVEKPQTVDHRADIYSLGVVFYEMLTGELPLGKFQPPSKKVQIDVRLDEVVLHALEKEPERRYQHASEVKTEVETIAATEKPEAGSQKSETAPRFSRTAIAGAVGVPVSLVPIIWFIALVRQMTASATPMTHDTSWLNISLGIAGFMGLVLIAPLLTSVLGWTAVAQIRRSAGRIFGLRLALFDGLFFPLLMLDGMIAGLWTFLQKILATFVWKVPGGSLFFTMWDFLIWLVLLAGIILWVDSDILRRVWRAVNNPNTPSKIHSSLGKDEARPLIENSFGRALVQFFALSVGFLIICLVVLLGMSSEAIGPKTWGYFRLGFEILAVTGSLIFFFVIYRAIKTNSSEAWRSVRAALPWLIFMVLGILFGFWSPHLLEKSAETKSDYIGQTWFPEGDSIEITSVERNENQITVKGHYNLVSHDSAMLVLYITTTNSVGAWTETDLKQEMDISKGRGDFELTDTHLISGLPHVSMYADHHLFASLYFGTKAEASEENKLNVGYNQAQAGEQYIQQQLKLAAAGNYWAKFQLWQAFSQGEVPVFDSLGNRTGEYEVTKDPAKADKWLAELVKGAYLAKFEPVNGFSPSTPGEMLDQFSKQCGLFSGKDSLGGASFFRTTNQNGKLIGSFLTELPDEFKAAVEKSSNFKLISIEKVTPEMFLKHEASKQESLYDSENLETSPQQSLRGRFEKRMAQDRDKYTADQLREAENLMRIADEKFGSPEANESCQTLIKKYPDSDRAGCAMLYLAQMSHGDERAQYLQECIDKYNDCFYGDGVQVGAYARFLLAEDYKNQGETQKAETLFNEIETEYADAIDHRGNLLVDSLKADVSFTITDQVLVEHAAMHVLAAVRDKDDDALKGFATDERVKGWRDALPEFAFELREKFHQLTGKPFDLHVSESQVRGDEALVKCDGPAELNGKYLALFFVKTDDGWENCYMRSAAPQPLKLWWKWFPGETNSASIETNAEDAVSAAQKWLALIDAGNYSESWKQASAFFQGAVTEAAWENSMNAFRTPLGALVSRKLISSQRMTEMPGAPDGQYVLMQFETSFADKKSAIETVTFMLEKDGQWKSAGYFIK